MEGLIRIRIFFSRFGFLDGRIQNRLFLKERIRIRVNWTRIHNPAYGQVYGSPLAIKAESWSRDNLDPTLSKNLDPDTIFGNYLDPEPALEKWP